MMPGRPGPRRWVKFHFWATKRRCHRIRVSGETIGVEFQQGFSPYCLGLARQKSTLSIGEPDSLSLQPLLEQAILGLEEFDDEQLMPMDPARHHHQEKRQQRGHRTHANILLRPRRSNLWTARGE